jgi:hypothetical protein
MLKRFVVHILNGTPEPKASARIQIVTDTEVLEKRGFGNFAPLGGTCHDSESRD